MSIDERNEKATSFWQMLKNTNVKIPSIQRDYAQGRIDESTKKIRENFLKALYDALTKRDSAEENGLKLDFVYGSTNKGYMEPLDGQQRLTTLWLLHWFIAKQSDAPKEEVSVLKNFSYEIRISSERFCEKLVDCKFPHNLEEKISDYIKNEAWFFSCWDKDPTIQGMLNMLDSIQSMFENTEKEQYAEYWALLTNHSPIGFYYQSLDEFSLTEELYIKMNARGKQLTMFENLKAKLISKSDKNGWEESKEYKNRIDYKFDVDWTKIFWKYRSKQDKNDTDDSGKSLIDDKLLNLLMVGKMIDYSEKDAIYENSNESFLIRQKFEKGNKKNRQKINITEETVKNERINERIKKIHGNPQELDACDFDDLLSVNRFFELYENEDFRTRKPGISLFDHSIGKTLFETAIAYDGTILSFREAALFYAQSLYFEYIKAGKLADTQFDIWMRIMRNIVSAAWIEDSASFRGAVKCVKKLAEICLNNKGVYSNLMGLNPNDFVFAKDETKFECLKAKIIVNANFDSNIINSLYALEDLPYFKASNNYKENLKFALYYCLDVSEDHLENYTVERASIIYTFIKNHFTDSEISNSLRAAMLLYDPSCYGKPFSVSYKLGGLPKYRFFKNTDSFKKDFEFEKSAFELLLKDILNSPNHKIEDILSNASNTPGWNNLPNWKKKIVTNPNLLSEHCSSHLFSAPDDDSFCLLFEEKQRPESEDQCFRLD